MSLSSLLNRLREEPEWTILGLLTVVLLVGGSVLYYNRTLQAEQRAQRQFDRAMTVYTQAQRTNDYERAVTVLERFIQNQPQASTTDKALFFLGKSFYATENYVQAQKQFARLVEQHPQSNFALPARLHIALCMDQREESGAALDVLTGLAEDAKGEPLWAEVMWHRALLERKTDRPEAARRTLKALVENAPPEASYWQSMAETMLNNSQG